MTVNLGHSVVYADRYRFDFPGQRYRGLDRRVSAPSLRDDIVPGGPLFPEPWDNYLDERDELKVASDSARARYWRDGPPHSGSIR
jgi:hypothetical protein